MDIQQQQQQQHVILGSGGVQQQGSAMSSSSSTTTIGGGSNNNNNNISRTNNPTTTTNILNFHNEQTVIRRAGKAAICSFLQQHNCYAVLRTSGKVVIFDIRIPIQLAFYALVEHDMLCAPLWCSTKCQFVGILTVTDFITILRHYKTHHKDVSELAVESIATVLQNVAAISSSSLSLSRAAGTPGQQQQEQQPFLSSSASNDNNNDNNNTNKNTQQTTSSSMSSFSSSPPPPHRFRIRPFIGADASCTLKQACIQLHNSGDDFLPIVYTADMRVLSCITYTNILEHLVLHFREQRRLFDDTIMDLNIGTYGIDNIIRVYPTHTLYEALELMEIHKLSALPIVESETKPKLLGVYSANDITFLTKATDANDAVTNLNLTLDEILKQQHQQQQIRTNNNNTNNNNSNAGITTGGGGSSSSATASTSGGGGGGGSSNSSKTNAGSSGKGVGVGGNDVVTTPDALRTCTTSMTLQSIFESFCQYRFNRLYIVNDNNNQCGGGGMGGSAADYVGSGGGNGGPGEGEGGGGSGGSGGDLVGVVSASDLVAYFLQE